MRSGSHGGAQGEKDTFSSMKSIWVLLQISYIDRVEPRYTSAGNYNFEQYKKKMRRHVKNKPYEVQGYVQRLHQDGFTCALLTKKKASS